MSLRIAPPASHRHSTTNLTTSTNNNPSTSLSAPSAPGLHDTLRAAAASQPDAPAPAPAAPPHLALPPPTSAHPLETRLLHWRATQHALKMQGLRRAFGVAEPVRRDMELGIVRAGEWRAAALGGSAGVHGDVLEGRDASLEWEDVFGAGEAGAGGDFHAEMEARSRMDW